VTDHVRAEVPTHYPAQLATLGFALLAGHLLELSLTGPAEHAVFAEMQKHRLGDGECTAIAAASVGRMSLAIDDIRAKKKAAAHDPGLALLDTIGLMLEVIQAGLLTVAEADAIKVDGEANHHVIEKHFKSRAELIP